MGGVALAVLLAVSATLHRVLRVSDEFVGRSAPIELGRLLDQKRYVLRVPLLGEGARVNTAGGCGALEVRVALIER